MLLAAVTTSLRHSVIIRAGKSNLNPRLLFIDEFLKSSTMNSVYYLHLNVKKLLTLGIINVFIVQFPYRYFYILLFYIVLCTANNVKRKTNALTEQNAISAD